jgi:hypothetical protein
VKVLFALAAALVCVAPSFAQDKKAVSDEGLIGDWKVSLTLDSEPPKPAESGYTKFSRLQVAKDGTCELFGKSDSSRAEYRHRDFTAIGTLGGANKDGVMDLNLEFATDGKGSGKVVWRGIAKRDGAVLIIALGRAWSEARPKSFDDVMAASYHKSEAKHTTLIVLGVDKK